MSEQDAKVEEQGATQEKPVDEKTSLNDQSSDTTPAETGANTEKDVSLLAQKKHFREVAEREKAARIAAENKLKAIEEEKMKEDKKYKELYEKKDVELSQMKERINREAAKSAVIAEVSKHSPVDLDIILSLQEKSDISVGEDGSVVGVSEFVESLVKDKPFLFKNSSVNSSASGQKTSKAPDQSNSGSLTQADVDKMTDAEYQKNAAEIIRLGLK